MNMNKINKNKMALPLMGLAVLMVFSLMELKAQDWSQWRGPNREGIVKKAGFNLDWAQKKPSLSWTFRQAGAGYSAPVVVGTTLYCQGAAEEGDFAFALDTKTGKLKWKQILGEQFVESRGNGPRGSVTVDGDKLYLIRGGGQIHCLSAADGKMLWQKDFKDDFDGKMMSGWGFSESPLIDGKLVIFSPGGSDGSVIALDKNTGATVWRTTDLTDNAAHSSAIVAEVDGIRQYILLTAKCAAGVAPKDGKLLWKVDVPGFRTAVIPTPIYHDHMVYITNGYNFGCILVKLTRSGDIFNTETVYANQNMMNAHGGVVLMNGYIYGYADRPVSGWVCQDLKTGENVWVEKNDEVSKGAVLAVNDRLLLMNEKGGMITVVAASPDGWKEFGRMPIPERSEIKTMDNSVWTHPVVADGKLFMRDHDLLFCFDLTK
jgi:outer membrane protein assembly factor BamB